MKLNEKLTKIFEGIDPTGSMPDEIKSDIIDTFTESVKELSLVEKKKYEHRAKKAILSIKEEANVRMKELAKSIKEACDAEIEEVTTAKDDEKAKAVESALEEQDKEYTEKMSELVEAIDKDRSAKLDEIVTKYESNIVNDKLVEQVSQYFDKYLEEVRPEETIVNECTARRHERLFSEMRTMLAVNDDYVQNEVAEAIFDAKSQLDEKDNKIKELMSTNEIVSEQVKQMEAVSLLESKVQDLTPKERAFIETRFDGCTASVIEEKFDEAVKAFKKDEMDRLKKLTKKSSSKVKSKIKPIENVQETKKPSKAKVMTESTDGVIDKSADGFIDEYANMCKRK